VIAAEGHRISLMESSFDETGQDPRTAVGKSRAVARSASAGRRGRGRSWTGHPALICRSRERRSMRRSAARSRDPQPLEFERGQAREGHQAKTRVDQRAAGMSMKIITTPSAMSAQKPALLLRAHPSR
jgi:hypothetical protein